MSTLVTVGLCTVDLVQRVEELPMPGQKVQSTSVELVAGGPAANAAIAAARLGGRPRLTTVLGSHPLAELARDDLAAWGVQVFDVLPMRVEPPAVSAVSVREADGERTVVSHNALGVSASAEIDLSGAGALLLDGHHPDLAVRAARQARELGVPVVLDAGSWKPVFDELMPHVDFCASSSAFRIQVDCPVVTQTHGPDPVRWRVGTEQGEVAVEPVAARDTSGAGDVWHGALALGVARLGRVPGAADMPALITFANRAAGIRVRHEGASWRAELR